MADAPLDACGCCEGMAPATPATTANPPGQTRLDYRVGTHARFKASMLAAIGAKPALTGLTSRADADPSVALMDAFATALDVLTFYNERFVNEGYLRTAAERRSVLELARAIGYELAPGVAASTYLAFTLEDAPGAPQSITIAAGARAQSIPGQDELPQVFETGAAIEARPAWNAMRPQLFARTLPKPNITSLWLEGTATNLRQGDAVLFIHGTAGGLQWEFRRLLEVKPDNDGRRTEVRWSSPLDHRASPATECYALRTRANLFGHNAPPATNLIAFGNIFEKAAKPTVAEVVTKAAAVVGEQAIAPFLESAVASIESAVQGLREATQAFTGSVDMEVLPGAQTITSTLSGLAENLDDINYFAGQIFQPDDPTEVPGHVQDLVETSTAIAEQMKTILTALAQTGINAMPHTLQFAASATNAFVNLKLKEMEAYASLIQNTANAIPQAMSELGQGVSEIAAQGTAKIKLPDDDFASNTTVISLDSVYGQVTEQSYAVLVTPTGAQAFKVLAVTEESVADFNMSAKCTQLKLNQSVPGGYTARKTTVYCQSERLTVAEAPLADPMPRNLIALDRIVDGLAQGQRLAFTGRTVDADGNVAAESASEIAGLASAGFDDGRTWLTLTADLKHDFQRASVRICGNVASATHGETRKEVLGSGDASVPLQAFTLKQTPLTYVRATNAAGAASTLDLRVNGVLWGEMPSLYTAQRDDAVYMVRRGDDGQAVVTFGDGARGRRLPSGSENVEATYRVGIGEAGLVKANQISLLVTRPLGVKEVVNPTAPEGAENPESLDTARDNALLKVLTLDRVVSLTDFENFARAFGGIAKARAVWLWDGEKRLVHITLAAPRAQPVAADSDLGQALRTALDGARHPDIPVRLGAMDLRQFTVHARVKVDSRYETEAVHAAVKERLAQVFSFERMQFAEGIAASRVLAEMQAVAGVVAIDLDALFFLPATSPTPATGLPALGARWAGTAIAADQLLAIDAAAIQLTDLTP